MSLFRMFARDDRKPAERRGVLRMKRVAFALIIAALFAGCAGCSQCKSCKSGGQEPAVIRTPSDVSDFSVVFLNGEATLFWVDSRDSFLDHIEITWDPDGSAAVSVPKGTETLVIPGLDLDKVYNFTVRAVDQWGNKSDATTGGVGKAFKQRRSASAPAGEIMGIKGTPVASQATLSWTNLPDSEYDHIEITFDPGQEALFRVPKGVESKTLMGLTNGVEHTFYAAAVDSQGNRKPLNDVGLFIPNYATSPESVFGHSSAGQITLVWTDPANANLDHLEVVYSPAGEVPVAVARGVQTHTFTDLNDSTNYEFTVYAADTGGRLRPVTGVNLLTSALPAFSSEEAEAFVIRGKPVAGQIKLDWNDPALAGLDHIEIIYDPGGGEVPVRIARGVETHTFTGLSDNIEYSFMVYGVDGRGNKRAIQGVKLSTPDVPKLIAKPVSGEVTVVWKDPDEPNLDHVELTYSPGGQEPVSVAKGIETHTFTGLSDNIEYEFNVTAVITEGDTHAVAVADVFTPDLPVIIGIPTDGRLSIGWDDPTDIKVDHVEIVYSPGGESVRLIARGMENQTFTGLTDGREYAFTVYAVDDTGNKHPINSAHFFVPEEAVQVASPVEQPPARYGLGPLIWKPTNDTTFGESTVLALAYGTAANGAGRWVAGGTDGKIAYSNDFGINWEQVGDSTFGSFSVNAICYANGRWVAGGRSGKMAWSTNAISWTAVKDTQFTIDHNVNAIAFGNGRWVAGGSTGEIIWSDDNGVSWKAVTISSFGNNAINSVAFYRGRWIAAGVKGNMAYSDDNGLTWKAVPDTSFGESDIMVVGYDRERWFAGGYGQRVAWSNDGLVWRTITRPFYILGLGFNGSRWIAGGQDGRMAWSGDSGDTWNSDSGGRNLFGESWVQTIAFGRTSGGGRWLSGGQNGKIIYADEQEL